MWKPGQLVTICGEVYRIKRFKGKKLYVACTMSCLPCAFRTITFDCLLSIYEPKYRSCNMIPEDCYFERL